MHDLLQSVKISLGTKNFYGALFVALAIPDICVSAQRGKTSRALYIEWFETNMTQYKGFLSGNDCYAFRCSLLHQGIDDISGQRVQETIDRFVILDSPNASHFTMVGGNTYNGVKQNNRLLLNIYTFCTDLIEAASRFFKENDIDPHELIQFQSYYDDGHIRVE